MLQRLIWKTQTVVESCYMRIITNLVEHRLKAERRGTCSKIKSSVLFLSDQHTSALKDVAAAALEPSHVLKTQ